MALVVVLVASHLTTVVSQRRASKVSPVLSKSSLLPARVWQSSGNGEEPWKVLSLWESLPQRTVSYTLNGDGSNEKIAINLILKCLYSPRLIWVRKQPLFGWRGIKVHDSEAIICLHVFAVKVIGRKRDALWLESRCQSSSHESREEKNQMTQALYNSANWIGYLISNW